MQSNSYRHIITLIKKTCYSKYGSSTLFMECFCTWLQQYSLFILQWANPKKLSGTLCFG